LCQHTEPAPASVPAEATTTVPASAVDWWNGSAATTDQPVEQPRPAVPPVRPANLRPVSNLALVGLLGLALLCVVVPLLLIVLSNHPAKVIDSPSLASIPQTPESLPAPTPVASPDPEPGSTPEPVAVPEPEKKDPEKKDPALPPLPPVPETPPIVAKQPDPMPEFPPARRVVGKLQKLSEEELRRLLEDVPEVNIERVKGATKTVVEHAKILKDRNVAFLGPIANLPQRSDLQGLPMRMGKECHLGKEEAENLHALSRKMRTAFEQAMQDARTGRGIRAGAVGADPRIDADSLLSVMGAAKDWSTPDAIPTLMQMMTPENKPVRKVLVELLARIDDKRATTALAMRAVTDLAPDVRQAALDALRTRSAEDYRPILLAGLRYPFPAIAEQAAEAVVALDDKESIPALVKMLDLPTATMPAPTGASQQSKLVVREMVKINHLSNCALCHQPSFDRSDLVRGAMPNPGQAIPGPASTPAYYERDRGDFVRADITYLRQDFSVVQPVPVPNNWPNFQRFDYVVRLRTPTDKELGGLLPANLEKAKNPSRDAVLFALKELTGKEMGKTSKDWSNVTAALKEPATNEDLAKSAGRDWRQFVTTLLPEVKPTPP
jgi:hypothetical protein